MIIYFSFRTSHFAADSCFVLGIFNVFFAHNMFDCCIICIYRIILRYVYIYTY